MARGAVRSLRSRGEGDDVTCCARAGVAMNLMKIYGEYTE